MLARLSSLPEPIRIGLIGMGSMGKGLLHQIRITPGLECVAMADVVPQRAVECAEMCGVAYRVARNQDDANDIIRSGRAAICEDGAQVACCTGANVVVESSSAVFEGGQYAVHAIESGKHVVMMNSEADLIFGPGLMRLAHQHGVVYTSCDGDQHGVIRGLVDELRLWGFELVMAGNIKGFLDRYSDPTKIIPEADARNLDYRMAAAYTDGTKLSIEMALVANAMDLRTRRPGMCGPRAQDVQDVFQLFDFESIRTEGEACVDYILGATPGGGVFAVGYCEQPYQRNMMAYYKMGPGPFYLFYRPYHLCHVEAMKCIADAALEGRSLLEPVYGFKTNVFAYAKRDLKVGDQVDGIGGYACYGQIDNCGAGHLGLPICLADGLRLRSDVARDEPLLLSHFDVPANREDWRLYNWARSATASAR